MFYTVCLRLCYKMTSLLGLLFGTVLIIYYELINQPEQLFFIGGLYVLLTVGAWIYSRMNSNKIVTNT